MVAMRNIQLTMLLTQLIQSSTASAIFFPQGTLIPRLSQPINKHHLGFRSYYTTCNMRHVRDLSTASHVELAGIQLRIVLVLRRQELGP